MQREPVIAVGLLTQRDLEVLGRGFTRHIPLTEDDNLFADLLGRLDAVEATPANSASHRLSASRWP